jgi:hypothetical protein
MPSVSPPTAGATPRQKQAASFLVNVDRDNLVRGVSATGRPAAVSWHHGEGAYKIARTLGARHPGLVFRVVRRESDGRHVVTCYPAVLEPAPGRDVLHQLAEDSREEAAE